MNERIFELAKQADIIQWDTLPSGARTPDHESVVKAKKFAELIVGECAMIAARTPCLYEDEFAKQTCGHTWDMACIESAKDIRKHFGIEQ